MSSLIAAQYDPPQSIITQLQAILARHPDADRLAFVWPEAFDWAQLDTQINGTAVRIVQCPSELAIREALIRHDTSYRLVLLTRLDQSKLGKDVLARLWNCEPQRISPWRNLQQMIHVQEIDPRLTRGKESRWMAEALLDCHDRYRDQVNFGEVLDLETAWLALAKGYLGFREPTLDMQALFQWSIEPDVEQRFAQLPEGVKAHLDDWLEPALPRVSSLVHNLLLNGYAHQLLAVGIACSVMYGEHLAAGQQMDLGEVHSGRGRFIERYLSGENIRSKALAEFGDQALDAARALLRDGNVKAVIPSLDSAEQILASLGFGKVLSLSPALPGGFNQRLSKYAEALSSILSGGDLTSAELAYRELYSHWLAMRPDRKAQLRRAEMALRLSRWLARREPEKTSGASQLLDCYLSDGSFVDWARSQLWEGDSHEQLNHVYKVIADKAAERRENHNKTFGRYLPELAKDKQLPPHQMAVELALERVLAPVAAEKPVLLLVLDGMSAAVYRELQEELAYHGWIEVRSGEGQPEPCLITAFPTVTEVSRCSLLSGCLAVGEAGAEKKAFANHPLLKKTASSRFPPVLLHKQDLQESGRRALATGSRALIASTEHRIVGAVINAIDDQLSSSGQVSLEWNMQTVPLLRQLLEAARESNRAIVVTSDHGHVSDHDSGFIDSESSGGERYRLEGSAGQLEVKLSGARVLTETQTMLIPWSERVRYTKARSNGYHGGGSLQEVTIPLGVYQSATDPEGLPGWVEQLAFKPAWWSEEDDVSMKEDATLELDKQLGRAAKKTTKVPADDRTDDLFELAKEPVENAKEQRAQAFDIAKPEWVDRLTASPVYQGLRRKSARIPVTDEQLKRFLVLLDQKQGTVMDSVVAAELKIPPIRMRGFLSAVQKLLNVDGYPILSVHRDSGTIKLDIGNLKRQFEL